jgi:hypothetical protein
MVQGHIEVGDWRGIPGWLEDGRDLLRREVYGTAIPDLDLGKQDNLQYQIGILE